MAMEAGFTAHRTNATWNITRPPANANIIGSNWVFSLKRDETEIIVRFKARLVEKGYAQEPGGDYNFTYAPVVNDASLRIFASRANELDYKIEQCDIDTAFLYGEVKERVFMAIPQGLELFFSIDKSLYGFKESADVWHNRIRQAFIKRNFAPLQPEPCIFVRSVNNDVFIYVTLYVDDMLIAAPTKQLAQDVISSLEELRLGRLGAARLVVGMEICRDHIVEKFGQIHAKVNVNSCKIATKLRRGGEGEGIDTTVYQYRSLIGSLLFVSMGTRRDIVCIVGKLSKYCESSTMLHQATAFVLTEMHRCAAIPTRTGSQMFNDRRSISGIMNSVALSTAEAEYVALSLCTQETVWARTLLQEMGAIHNEATTIFVDN
ncbi:reverse transcriptase [Phytophthora megakarya]|uniref:Reverse transcriptase n=1 Tax=Phytophthora megakarya TaxID=4795 RepID=A0A225UZ82_9STRA|nr:reverse transcriptase [Phytophthora megakarya]